MSNCTEDELFNQLRNELFGLLKDHCKEEEQRELKQKLYERYTRFDESFKPKPPEDIEPLGDDQLYDRYKSYLEKCSTHLEQYKVPNIPY